MMLAFAPLLRLLSGDVPVDPSADQARQWLVRELARPEYQAAQPNWFDRLSAAFSDWLVSLFHGDLGAAGVPILIAIVLVLVGVVVAAFFIFGAPRRNRRSSIVNTLFGEDDGRDAAAMRRAAHVAAASGDWALAIQEMFRAIARSLAERTLVDTTPGTTARGFAARAGRSFPPLAGRLMAAATVFDGVRYLQRAGNREAYQQLVLLERELGSTRPDFDSMPAMPVEARV